MDRALLPVARPIARRAAALAGAPSAPRSSPAPAPDTSQRRCSMHAGRGGGGGRRAGGAAAEQQGAELFSVDSGWNVEAFREAFDAADSGADDADEGTWGDGDSERDGGSSDDGGAPPGPGAAAARDLLAGLPPHLRRRLAAQQAEADAANAALRPAALRRAAARQKTHRSLRIVAGAAAGRRLLAPRGDQTRPMMEMVRGAVMDMASALSGAGAGRLPPGARWLDLFAGTGAVGLEALSRGAGACHFVELSPWVASACLGPNIEACGFAAAAAVHAGRAEDFLARAAAAGSARALGGAFDFVTVCPPYELVSYPELYDLLDASPLLKPTSVVVVEYPRRLAGEVRPRLGPGLVKLRDRRYGRTFVAVYAAAELAGGGGGEGEQGGGGAGGE